MEGAVDNKGNSRLSEAEGVERGAPPSRQPSCRDVCNVIAINHGPALARRATSPQTAAGMRQREKKQRDAAAVPRLTSDHTSLRRRHIPPIADEPSELSAAFFPSPSSSDGKETSL